MNSWEAEMVAANSAQWVQLCSDSVQSTPFIAEKYLAAVGFESKNIILKKKGSLLAGLCLPRRLDGSQAQGVPFAPYNGLIFSAQLKDQTYKTYKGRLDATANLVEYAAELYPQHFFSCHYTVDDVRSISWYNYHTPERGKYKVDILYSAVKDISDAEDIVNGLSKGRKYDYKQSVNKYALQNNIAEGIGEIEDFLSLYRMTFAKQEIFLDEQTMLIVENILKATLPEGKAILQYAKNTDGQNIAAVVMLYDENCAYYLFGANHPGHSSCGAGTFLLVESMKQAHEMGIKKFDFVGVNSPFRGDFKLSFGAHLVPYYVAKLNS